MTRVEFELASGFTELPGDLPQGVSVRLENGDLIYSVDATAPGFPRYKFELSGSGSVEVAARAFSAETELGLSETKTIALDGDAR